MTTTEVDADGYPATMRSATVDRVLARLQLRGITPAPEVLNWLLEYEAGEIRYAQLMALIYKRVDALQAKVEALLTSSSNLPLLTRVAHDALDKALKLPVTTVTKLLSD